jgi:hypothetical protein
MTTSSEQTITQLLRDNLLLVFGERDTAKRLSALSRLWFPSQQCRFIDPEGVFHDHKHISDFAERLLVTNPGKVFSELGKHNSLSNPRHTFPSLMDVGSVQVLAQDPANITVQVGRLKWGFGLPGETPIVTGEDVGTIIDGKIETLLTFVD